MVDKTLVAGTGITLTEDGDNLIISSSGGVTTTYAWNPLCPFDKAGTDGSYFNLSATPGTGFLKDDTDWWIAVRFNTVNRDNSITSLFTSDLVNGGVGIYQGFSSGTSGYWARMSSSSYLLGQTVDKEVDPISWIIFSWDATAGQFTAWVSGTKTNTGTSTSFASSEPTTFCFGQEAAGYTAGYFYGISGCSISAIVAGVGDTIDDTDATEFTSGKNGLTDFSATVQGKADSWWTFNASGPVTEKGSVSLTEAGTGSHAYVKCVIE